MVWLTLKKNCTLLRCFYCQLWTDFKFWTNFTYCSSLFIANLEQISLTVAVFYYWLWTKFAHCPNLNFLSLLLILKKHFNNNFLFYSIVKWNKLHETVNLFWYLEILYWILVDQFKIQFIKYIIHWGFNLLFDWDLVSVNFTNINLDITSKIVGNH